MGSLAFDQHFFVKHAFMVKDCVLHTGKKTDAKTLVLVPSLPFGRFGLESKLIKRLTF